MSDIAIRVEGLGKRYSKSARPLGGLRRSLGKWLRRSGTSPIIAGENPAAQNAADTALEPDEFWSLRDVSFEVKRGEVVGVIGRNGAGKSTLLKILSRITEPTTGRAEIFGRVGSLLEVGTGFHPELTGRENIYLNGALLRMSRAEVRRKFDEIVEFAEVAEFIDMPVKHYSSGMYMRLAFAVAAHLESEILFVDEVLAVGDAAFQKKCLGKMGDVAHEGRTVLFVSHNMLTVRMLCDRSVLIDKGHIAASGSTSTVLREIDGSNTPISPKSQFISLPEHHPCHGKYCKLVHIEVIPDNGDTVLTSSDIDIKWKFWCSRTMVNIGSTIEICNPEGLLILRDGMLFNDTFCSEVGFYNIAARIPRHVLNCGEYRVSVQIGENRSRVLARYENVLRFGIVKPCHESSTPALLQSLMKFTGCGPNTDAHSLVNAKGLSQGMSETELNRA